MSSKFSENDLRQIYSELFVLSKQVQLKSFRGNDKTTLSFSQGHALRILAENSEFSMGILAEDLGLNLSTVTKIIDVLERKKLVSRKSSLRDSRVMELKITKAGRDYVRLSQDEFLTYLSEHFVTTELSSGKSFLTCLKALNELVRSWNEKAGKNKIIDKNRDPENLNIVYRKKYGTI